MQHNRTAKKKVLNDTKHTWAVKKKNEIVELIFKALKWFLSFENGPVWESMNSHVLWLTFSFDFDLSFQFGFKLLQDVEKSWSCKLDSNRGLKVHNVSAWPFRIKEHITSLLKKKKKITLKWNVFWNHFRAPQNRIVSKRQKLGAPEIASRILHDYLWWL